MAATLLFAVTLLTACSGLASSNEALPASGPDPGYKQLVADRLRSSFKGLAYYDSFEISDPRWVHSLHGWAWLTCVRFRDHGQQRSYALFIDGAEVINSRYAVETDGCDAQAHAPFGLMQSGLQPLY